jgi:hypothetical protein
MGNNQSIVNRYKRLAKPQTNTNSPRLAIDLQKSKTSAGSNTEADINAAIQTLQEAKKTGSPEANIDAAINIAIRISQEVKKNGPSEDLPALRKCNHYKLQMR